MPVEIRELIIRAVATSEGEQAAPLPPQPEEDRDLDPEAIIQACVKQVLRILQKQKDR